MSYKNAKVGSTSQWFFQRLTAAALVIFVSFHFILTHYLILGQEITYKMVQQRLVHSSWRFFYIAFLALALFHGLNGIREFALDFKIGQKLEKLVTIVCVLIGLIFFAIGLWALPPF